MVQEEMKLVLEEDSYQYIYLFWGSFERRSEKKKFEKKTEREKSAGDNYNCRFFMRWDKLIEKPAFLLLQWPAL